MANQIHRQLEQGELHRPERTGIGSPVGQSFTFLEDGQYYQDTDTGSVWRYRAFTNSWEQLLQYDRGTGQITNVTTGVAVQATKIGVTTTAINAGTLTSIPAKLVTQVREGEDLKIISTASDAVTLSVTVSATTGSGLQSIPIQSVNTDQTFPEGSSIVLESGLQNSYDSVDPTKIERKLERISEGDAIGNLSQTIMAAPAVDPIYYVNSIELQRITPPLTLKDGQVLFLVGADGYNQRIIVDGDQTFNDQNGTLTIENILAESNYYQPFSYVREPSYVAMTRISQTENSIELQASQITQLDSFTSTLNVAVNQNSADITLLTQAQAGQNVAIAGLEANASAQQATLTLLTSFTDSLNTSVVSLEANASAQQATLTSLTSFTDGLNTSVVALQANASAQQALLSTSVQYNDVGAYIDLLAGPNGSSITLQADQINVDGVVTFINDNATTTIDGDRITTGTVTASQINTTSLFAQSIAIDSGNISFYENNTEVIRLGTDSGNTGLFLYDAGGAQLSSFKADGLIIGSDQSDTWNAYSETWNVSPEFNNYQYVSFDPENGLIVRGRISANDIVSGTLSASLIVGDIVKSDNFNAGVSGYAIFSNGHAEFGDVTVRGALIAGAGSSISGVYLNNVNADTITTGTLNVTGLISASSIDASKINVNDLFAQTITIQSGGSISGSNFTFNDTGGTIAGWIIEADTLKSAASGARIELNKADNRVSVFDAIGEKAAMGYLEGLPKNDASGSWTSADYGFWAKNGDRLVIDGDIEYDSGDWLIQNDASYKVLDGSATPKEIIRLGTASGQKGLFLYDANVTTTSNTDSNITYTTGDVIAKFISTGFSVGDVTSNNYIEYDQSNATLTLRGTLNASDIVTGTIDADRINVDALFAESATISNVISVGSSTSPMQIGVNLTYAGGLETGDGIKIDANNYWFFSTSEDVPVFRIGDASNYVSWTGSTLDVRGTLNASDIVSGTIDADRINTDALFADTISVTNTITLASGGEISGNGFAIGSEGVSLDLQSYFSTGSALRWTDDNYIIAETLGGVPYVKTVTTGIIDLFSGSGSTDNVRVTADGSLNRVSVSKDLLVSRDFELSGNAIIDSILIKLDNIPLSAPATPNCVWVDASGFLRLS